MKADFGARVRLLAERVGWCSLDLLFPPRCASCDREGERLCVRCRNEIEYLTGRLCQRCGYPRAASTPDCEPCRRMPFVGQGLRSLAFHSGTLRKAIHALKYRRNPPLSESCAELMSQGWPESLPADAVLMPVPLSSERMRERGFNQAELLARQLAHKRRLPVESDSLQRHRATRTQVGLNAPQRRDNVAGAFSAEPRRVKALSILLIDDVCTTGATLGACAAALLQSGAKQVWAYTLARARREDADPLS